MRDETAYNQVVAIFGYQNHSQYGEWLLDGDNGPRPCRFENWTDDDILEYVGGPQAKKIINNGMEL